MYIYIYESDHGENEDGITGYYKIEVEVDFSSLCYNEKFSKLYISLFAELYDITNDKAIQIMNENDCWYNNEKIWQTIKDDFTWEMTEIYYEIQNE